MKFKITDIKRIEIIKKRTSRILKKLFGLLPLSLLTLSMVYSCKSHHQPLTKSLFMQSKRANVELPPVLANEGGGNNSGLLTETVTYRHEDNRSEIIDKQDSIIRSKGALNEMQYLNEVTVTADIKQKFTPERDGKVNVDFIIRVPKELLSAHWQVSLSPKLLDNDSVVGLKDVMLKSSHFAAKQQFDSLAFATYENSIIPKAAYDSLFLDRKAIAHDLRKRQEYYYSLYARELKRVMGYLEWKNRMEERCAAYNSRIDGRRLELYHGYMRRSEEEAVRLLAAGGDTTGVSAKYLDKFTKHIQKRSRFHAYKKLTLSYVPKKYKSFFLNEIMPEEIFNHSTTEKDSVQISAHRYFFGRIAENETKNKRREELRRKMNPFPSRSGLYLDSIVNGEHDFVFLYRQEYPVSAGLNRLRIIMDGKITATDRSGYTLPPSDTLYYLISSLAQLADTSLILNRTKLYRNMYDRVTVYPQFEVGKSNFHPGFRNNKQQADTLINRYRKLTTEMGFRMDSIVIVSHTSLEGLYESNHKLSAQRAQTISSYLQATYPGLITVNTIRTIAKGEDWQELVNEINKRSDIANKDSVLSMIIRTVYPDQTKQEIRQRYKKDYSIIRDSVFPKLSRMEVTFHVSRAGMVASDSVQYETKYGYREGLRLLQGGEYWKALEILKDYPDYNTALCLACIGYNGKAYDLLVKLPETANNSYLLSILSVRMDKQEEAVKYLSKAIELDPSKAYRIDRDPEITGLVEKYRLRGRIAQLTETAYIQQPREEQKEEGD